MALTGLFLCTFLVVHLAGNLQLLLPKEVAQTQFNEYSAFMTSNPLIKMVSYTLYFSIIFHTISGVFLAFQNIKARPVKYQYNKPNKSSKWYSRQMAFLGIVILFFLVIHMKSFWYEYHFGILEKDVNGNKDLYTITVTAFKQIWYVLFYVVSMLAIGFHLFHGVKSTYQSLGILNKKIEKPIQQICQVFSVFITLLFALIPIVVYLYR